MQDKPFCILTLSIKCSLNFVSYPIFINFLYKSCPTCNKTTKLWQDLAKMINESENADIGIAEVDCTIETELCQGKLN